MGAVGTRVDALSHAVRGRSGVQVTRFDGVPCFFRRCASLYDNDIDIIIKL